MAFRFPAIFLPIAMPLALLMPMEARAQADPALAAYQQGTAAFNAGNFGDAAALFRKAMELRPAWKIRYNIAQSEASLKHYDLALEEFEAYLIEGGDDIPRERQAEVLGEIERLRMLVATVELEGAEQGEVYVNGVPRGELPEASRIKTTAGKVEITIRNGDKTIMTRTLRVTGGDTVRLDVDLDPQESSPTAQPQDSAIVSAGTSSPDDSMTSQPQGKHSGSKSRVLGWSIVGIGAATLVAGSVLGGIALSRAGSVKDQCIDGHCPPSSQSDAQTATRLALSADICFGTGAALALVGGLLGFGVFGKNESTQAAWTPMNGGGMLVMSRTFGKGGTR